MKINILAATAVLCAGAVSGPAVAQGAGGPPNFPTETASATIGDVGTEIDVTLPDVLGDNGEVQLKYTSYGDSISPAIEWTPVDGAETYVVMLQDPITTPNGAIVVNHWLAYNIPGTSLPEGVPLGAEIASGGAQAQGIGQGGPGYVGPRPPAGQPAHQYTFQVFALDTTLDLDAPDYNALLAAMDGHVIGAGSEVTPYTGPADAAPAGAPSAAN